MPCVTIGDIPVEIGVAVDTAQKLEHATWEYVGTIINSVLKPKCTENRVHSYH